MSPETWEEKDSVGGILEEMNADSESTLRRLIQLDVQPLCPDEKEKIRRLVNIAVLYRSKMLDYNNQDL